MDWRATLGRMAIPGQANELAKATQAYLKGAREKAQPSQTASLLEKNSGNSPSVPEDIVLVFPAATDSRMTRNLPDGSIASECGHLPPECMEAVAETLTVMNKQFEDQGIRARWRSETSPSNVHQIESDRPLHANEILVDHCKRIETSGFGEAGGIFTPPRDSAGTHHGVFENSVSLAYCDKGTVTHELTHAVGVPHPRQVMLLADMNPDLARAICNGLGGGLPQSKMEYPSTCNAAGYAANNTHYYKTSELGTLDLCVIEMTASPQSRHDAILGRCGNHMADELARQYGAPIAAYFCTSAIKEIVERTLIKSVHQNLKDPIGIAFGELAVKLVATTVEAVTLDMLLFGSATVVNPFFAVSIATLAHFSVGGGAAGETARAFLGLAGYGKIGYSVAQVIQGNAVPLASILAGACGKAAPQVAYALIQNLAECLTTRPAQQQEGDVEQQKISADADYSTEKFQRMFVSGPECGLSDMARAQMPEPLLRTYDNLVAVDRRIGAAIEHCVQVNCKTNWVYETERKLRAETGSVQAVLASTPAATQGGGNVLPANPWGEPLAAVSSEAFEAGPKPKQD